MSQQVPWATASGTRRTGCSPGGSGWGRASTAGAAGSSSSLPELIPLRLDWLMAPLMFSKPRKDLPPARLPGQLRQKGMGLGGQGREGLSLRGAIGGCERWPRTA